MSSYIFVEDWIGYSIQLADAVITMISENGAEYKFSTLGESSLIFDIHSSYSFKLNHQNYIALLGKPDGNGTYRIDGQGVFRKGNTIQLGKFCMEDVHGRLTVSLINPSTPSEAIYDIKLCMWATEGYGFSLKYYTPHYISQHTKEDRIGYYNKGQKE